MNHDITNSHDNLQIELNRTSRSLQRNGCRKQDIAGAIKHRTTHGPNLEIMMVTNESISLYTSMDPFDQNRLTSSKYKVEAEVKAAFAFERCLQNILIV